MSESFNVEVSGVTVRPVDWIRAQRISADEVRGLIQALTPEEKVHAKARGISEERFVRVREVMKLAQIHAEEVARKLGESVNKFLGRIGSDLNVGAVQVRHIDRNDQSSWSVALQSSDGTLVRTISIPAIRDGGNWTMPSERELGEIVKRELSQKKEA